MKGQVIRVSHYSDYSAQILAPYLLEHIPNCQLKLYFIYVLFVCFVLKAKAHYQLVVCFKELTTTSIIRPIWRGIHDVLVQRSRDTMNVFIFMFLKRECIAIDGKNRYKSSEETSIFLVIMSLWTTICLSFCNNWLLGTALFFVFNIFMGVYTYSRVF